MEQLIKNIVKNARLRKPGGSWVFSDEKIVDQILIAFNHFFKEAGKRGGETTKKLFGEHHFSKIGKKGGWPKGKKRKKSEPLSSD